jgi:uncharacterized protein with HEPN domain
MNTEQVLSMHKITKIHIERINQALDNLKNLFPLDINKVQNLNENAIFSIEMLTSRFAKLQDYLGAVVFDVFFEIEGEDSLEWTPIDKINKLEKYGIINNAHEWRQMRKSRNFLTHEYPDQPEIIATNLNLIYNFIPLLIDINNKLFAKIFRDIDN